MLFGGGRTPGDVALTESWNGTAWTELADLSVARDQLGGSTNGTSLSALAFGGDDGPADRNITEEWTVPESISNLTITD